MASKKPSRKQQTKAVSVNDTLRVHRIASRRHLNIGQEIAKVFASRTTENSQSHRNQ